MPDDDPIGGTLGAAGVDPRLPPAGRRRRRSGEKRRRRRSTRELSPEERDRARRDLEAEVERGNGILKRLGHKTTLELIPGSAGAPDRVAVGYPADESAGARCVVRTVRLRELQKWLARLESLEGLVIDEER